MSKELFSPVPASQLSRAAPLTLLKQLPLSQRQLGELPSHAHYDPAPMGSGMRALPTTSPLSAADHGPTPPSPYFA